MKARTYYIANCVTLAALSLGLAYEVKTAEYLGIGILWLTIVTSPLALTAPAQRLIKVSGPSAPLWLNLLFDVTFLGLLLWGHWYVTAGFYIGHCVIASHAFKKAGFQ